MADDLYSKGEEPETLAEIIAEVHGMRMVLEMLLTSLPAPYVTDFPDRLAFLEAQGRKMGLHSGTIETLRLYREKIAERL